MPTLSPQENPDLQAEELVNDGGLRDGFQFLPHAA
jgi:hypothetical protein